MVQADLSCLPRKLIHPSEFWTLNVNIQVHINDKRIDSRTETPTLSWLPFLITFTLLSEQRCWCLATLWENRNVTPEEILINRPPS